MVDWVPLLASLSVWFLIWHVLYVKSFKLHRGLVAVVFVLHLLLIWLVIALLFYWVMLRSSLLFGLLSLLVVFQWGYWLRRYSNSSG